MLWMVLGTVPTLGSVIGGTVAGLNPHFRVAAHALGNARGQLGNAFFQHIPRLFRKGTQCTRVLHITANNVAGLASPHRPQGKHRAVQGADIPAHQGLQGRNDLRPDDNGVRAALRIGAMAAMPQDSQANFVTGAADKASLGKKRP